MSGPSASFFTHSGLLATVCLAYLPAVSHAQPARFKAALRQLETDAARPRVASVWRVADDGGRVEPNIDRALAALSDAASRAKKLDRDIALALAKAACEIATPAVKPAKSRRLEAVLHIMRCADRADVSAHVAAFLTRNGGYRTLWQADLKGEDALRRNCVLRECQLLSPYMDLPVDLILPVLADPDDGHTAAAVVLSARQAVAKEFLREARRQPRSRRRQFVIASRRLIAKEPGARRAIAQWLASQLRARDGISEAALFYLRFAGSDASVALPELWNLVTVEGWHADASGSITRVGATLRGLPRQRVIERSLALMGKVGRSSDWRLNAYGPLGLDLALFYWFYPPEGAKRAAYADCILAFEGRVISDRLAAFSRTGLQSPARAKRLVELISARHPDTASDLHMILSRVGHPQGN